MSRETPSRILVAMPTWVGDAVMATGLLEAIHETHPEARIDLLLKPYLRGLLEDAPWLHATIPFTGGFHQLRMRLTREKYDWGVLLSNSFRPAILMWLAGVRRRAGYARNGRGPLLTDRLKFPNTHKKTVPFRMIDFYGAIGEQLGVTRPVRPVKLHAGAEVRERVERLFAEHGIEPGRRLVGLNPGAKYGAAKLWPLEHFARVGDDLAETLGSRVIVLAGPGEDELAGEIAKRMRHDAIVPPSSAVDLATLKGVMRKLDLLVTNDTGPRQIAAAFGVPTVTLFGPTHPTWGDGGFEATVNLSLDLDCGPCMKRTCPLGHHRCMVDLTPDLVVTAAESLCPAGSRPADGTAKTA